MAPCTRPRTRRSKTTVSMRSPARLARAASRSDDSKAVSIRGSSAMRAADVRPLSTTITTRRSRSGRQVRTIRSSRLAVARQSIDRTSSPRTYSRRLSNSVPWPRTCILVAPSSSRSRAILDGRCLREVNGGSTRSTLDSVTVACRATRPSGPKERMVTCSALRSPRRNGVSIVRTARRSPAGMDRPARVGAAPAEGCQPSRRTPRTRRPPRFVTVSTLRALSPSRTRDGSSRESETVRGEPARTRSTVPTTSTTATQARRPVPSPKTAIGRMPSATNATNQPETATRSGPAPAAGSTAGSCRPTPPRARPPAGAGCGDAARAGPSPGCGRG